MTWMISMLMFQVMDSVISLFRVDVTGRGELGDRQVSFTGSVQCLYSLRSYALCLYP
ncbi:putative DNA recombination and repair protein Rad51 [Rosa chinensis]|uniref:Putative DNA recombination and repair protein Rad51 n=1 Tax=Rosa chinensis TaxID=74649 RepID=A0A2P6Q717_ROSCH|nr:putative DNA recombination and repair protein Rad51 [Rosa chinensis]